MNDDISPEAREAAEVNLAEFEGITPGEWRADEGLGFVGSIGPKRQLICQMWDKFEDDFPNHEANCRAIAALPKLLRALDAQTKELARLRETVKSICELFTDSTPENISMVVGAYVRTIQGVKDRLLIENDSLRAENERLTRERDLYLGIIRYVCKTLECVDCGAAPPEELARRASARIATLEQQVSDERNLGDCLASALLGDFPARGALERYRDAVHEDSREEVQERIDAYFNTAATNEGGSEG